jgi:hypothetical protein
MKFLTYLVITVNTFYIPVCYSLSIESTVKSYGFTANFANYETVSKDVTRKGDVLSFRTLELVNQLKKSRIEIEFISPLEISSASEQIKSKYSLLYSMYNSHATPYPGTVTNSNNCSNEFLPANKIIKLDGNLIRVVTVGVNDRDTYGACSKEEVKKKGIFLMFYIKKTKTLAQFKSFSWLENDDRAAIMEIIESITLQ